MKSESEFLGSVRQKSQLQRSERKRERDLFHLKSEPVKGNLGAGGKMDEQEMDQQNKRHTSSSDIWLLFHSFNQVSMLRARCCVIEPVATGTNTPHVWKDIVYD